MDAHLVHRIVVPIQVRILFPEVWPSALRAMKRTLVIVVAEIGHCYSHPRKMLEKRLPAEVFGEDREDEAACSNASDLRLLARIETAGCVAIPRGLEPVQVVTPTKDCDLGGKKPRH